jgi:hypothetical protein
MPSSAPPIPEHVHEEIAAAARLAAALERAGRRVRFAVVGGRVIASLCERDGTVLRVLSLTDVVDGRV